MSNVRVTISACILARNEQRQIADALRSLQEWTDQILVIDNESDDDTAAIARRFTDFVLTAPRADNFDALRNLAIEHARGDWIFYLDADERVPYRLGQLLRQLVQERGHEFEALRIPFKHCFCGKWMQHSGWWPGYTRPQLLKRGHFQCSARLHSGVEVEGRILHLPADDPDLAIVHYSYDNLSRYLTKLNPYTTGEAESFYQDGRSHAWQVQLAHFVHDWQIYYEQGRADLDGMHGFVLSFLSAFYRFFSRAKLWDLRRKQRNGETAKRRNGEEETPEAVPANLREMLDFMARVLQEGAQSWLAEPHSGPASHGADGSLPLEPSSTRTQGAMAEAAGDGTSGISACIVARNEEQRVEPALRSLQGWTDRTIFVDNASDDATAAIARRYTEILLTAPPAPHFEAARFSVADQIDAIAYAEGDWLFYLDADERVPPRLGEAIRRLVRERGEEFDALFLPIRHHFCGKWMEHCGWWPGYKCVPQLVRKGAFRYNAQIHSGGEVHGRVLYFPAVDTELALVHESIPDLFHYLAKINGYTDAEALTLYAAGASHSWQAQLAHFVHDWQDYYERGRGGEDGMHGFVLSFLAGLYRFLSRAKLWELRRKRGELAGADPVPADLGETLAFMARVAQEGAGPWLEMADVPAPGVQPSPGSEAPKPVPLLWHAPLLDPSGYADEARNFILGLVEAGEPVAVAPIYWTHEEAELPPDVSALLRQRMVPPDTPAELFVSQMTPPLNRPSPHAAFSIVRTMFETDRLQPGWESVLNALDRVWVPSEFNRESFVRSGVDPARIAVIPGAVDAAAFAADVAPWPVPGSESFRFLTVFDWTLHKGWDVLLEAFAAAFGDEPEVGLILKVWSSNGYTMDEIRRQADQHLRHALGRPLEAFPHIHLWQERIPTDQMPRLYRAVHAFVLPTRGEGWGRPLMEAMAAGLPAIATAWSGLTAFHNARVGYPLKYRLVPVSEAGAREIPIYAGHCWAEPDKEELRRLMRRMVAHPEAAREKGRAAQQLVARRYSRAAVATLLRKELAHCRKLARDKAVLGNGRSASSPTTCDAILLQCARGEQEALLELTRGHHEAYARAHGIDYLCRIRYPSGERHPGWDKIALIREVLREGKYELLVWLDADTLIVDPHRDLRGALPAGAWLGMVQHGDPPYFNNGVLYVRNTPEARAFFDEVWGAWPVDHPWEDNAALIRVLERDPARWTGVVVLDDRWNSTLRVNESPAPVVKAWHGFGTIPDRLASMATTLSELTGTPRSAPPAAQPRPAPVRPKSNPAPLDPPEPVEFRGALGRPLRVRWEGDQSVLSSLALVNREFCLQLLAAGDVELSLSEWETPWRSLTERDDPRFGPLFARIGVELSGPPDVTIRHHFPPDWQRPATGKLVVIQPWEYGHLPRAWVEGAIRDADEVWAYSRFVRDVYVRSGVPAEKVRVVPLGVRTQVFTPDGPRYSLQTQKGVRFLFVGGAIHRKGADLLLTAYRRAFHAADDVCLVVKDMGTATFYQGQSFGDDFRRLQNDPAAPEVIYLDDDLSEPELIGLYRGCTCVVLPYRAEGFGLPPLEGMACGLLAIVTAGGPTDDYLDDSLALRVPFHRRYLGTPYAGALECAGDPWSLEPDLDALVDALRWVRDHPEEARARGEAARAHVLAGWTWDRAAGIARERLAKLALPAGLLLSPPAKLWAEPGATADGRRPTAERSISKQGSGKSRKSGKGKHGKIQLPAGSPELSLCMIARDEETRIANSLQSIAPYVDEMIVIDTGSTDRTREFALACGARVFDFAWTDSFAEARNQSLAQARGAWIFWMDADDVIPPECGQQLRGLIHRHPKRDAAYQVQVRIPPGPGEFGPSVVDHVKLFPNRQDLRFEHRIHEQILPAIRQAGLEVCVSDLYVTHENYDRSPRGQAKKRQRDFRLLELDLKDRPDHPFVLFNLGMTYLYATKEYEVAAHYLRRSLDRSHWTDSIVRKAYAMLTTARICQMDREAAIAVNEEGRTHYPEDAELLFQAGQIYQQVGRFDEARMALERLVAGEDDAHYRSVDCGLRTYRGRHELALLFRTMGDGRHCEQVLREIATAYPFYLPAHLDLVETLQLLGKSDEARDLLARIPLVEGIKEERQRLCAQLGLRDPARSPEAGDLDWQHAPVFGRRETVLNALQTLYQLHPEPACIVETGTLRNDTWIGYEGDGWSTVAWGWYSLQTGGKAYTVDQDARAIEVCRRATAPYASALEYVAADSVTFLRQWPKDTRGEIHFLYLDSLDCDHGQQEVSAAHHEAEAEAALPALATPCLVLIDDTWPLAGTQEPSAFDGKGARAVPFLMSHGFRIERTEGKQVLLSRGAGRA